jgi:PPK2 family polyphosphate:nucleotide phosphotransferase
MRGSVAAAASDVARPTLSPPRPLVCKDAAMGKGSKAKAAKKDTKGKSAKGGSAKGRSAKGRAGAPSTSKVTPDRKLSGKAAEKAKRKRAEAAKARRAKTVEPVTWTDALRVGPGFVLGDLDPRSTPGFTGDKAEGKEVMGELQARLGDLQERLYAESKGGGQRSVLLVIQGMDTSGKGGIMRHVVGAVDPQGVHITSFKAPTAEEKRHRFLWRIRNALPEPGQIGVFDRSHYEDVLIVRVHGLVPRATWMRRYAQINAFEQGVVDSGTVIVKVMMHISGDEQKARLAERLEREDKHWKFNPGDIDERVYWSSYQEAYEIAIERTNTEVAPWLVVPSDRKWYRNWAMGQLLLETLEGLELAWPEADFDVEEQRRRLVEEGFEA